MENFKLTNLRELSTEEQLSLDGGTNAGGCSCKCSCNCGPGVYEAGFAGGSGAKNEINEKN